MNKTENLAKQAYSEVYADDPDAPEFDALPKGKQYEFLECAEKGGDATPFGKKINEILIAREREESIEEVPEIIEPNDSLLEPIEPDETQKSSEPIEPIESNESLEPIEPDELDLEPNAEDPAQEKVKNEPELKDPTEAEMFADKEIVLTEKALNKPSMTKPKLIALAKFREVPVTEDNNKPEIINALLGKSI